MRYGTSYFPTKEDVIKYYKPLGFSATQALDKISSGEVHIGKPPGLGLYKWAELRKDQGGARRYFVFTARKP
tara:strand:+ start:1649 stop:1864 length:216 start_codon:yes stop_codon:yes gene_type:complete